MPNQVQINHGQLVQLIVSKNDFDVCGFLVQNIDDNTVFVLFDLNDQHLTIASCPSSLTEHEVNTIFRFWSSRDSYKAALITGKKHSAVAEKLRKKFSELKVKPQEADSFSNFYYTTNLSLFEKNEPMHFADQNPPLNFDKLKRGEEWPEYLYGYEEIPVDEEGWTTIQPMGDWNKKSNPVNDPETSSSNAADSDSESHKPKSVTSTSNVKHPTSTSTSTSTVKAIADDETDSDVYFVNVGQTAVIHLSDKRVVRCNLSNKAVAFAVCDETTKTLAISVMGNLVCKTVAQDAVKRCWASVLATLGQQNAEIKKHNDANPKAQIAMKQGVLYYQVFAPQGTNSETTDHLEEAIKDTVKSSGVKPDFKAIESIFGLTRTSGAHCTFPEFLIEMKNGKDFTVTAYSALLPQMYRTKPLSLSAMKLSELKLKDDTNPDKKRCRDFKS